MKIMNNNPFKMKKKVKIQLINNKQLWCYVKSFIRNYKWLKKIKKCIILFLLIILVNV